MIIDVLVSRGFALMLIICITLSYLSVEASGFEYGQCLIGEEKNKNKLDEFNKTFSDYRMIALAKASIKQHALTKNPNLLKWNYETTSFIYSLSVVYPALVLINDILANESDEGALKLYSFLKGARSHLLISSLNDLEDEKAISPYNQLLKFLKDPEVSNEDIKAKLHELYTYFEKKYFRSALYNAHYLIQKLSLSNGLLDSQGRQEWLSLINYFNPENKEKKMDLSVLLNNFNDFQKGSDDYFLTPEVFENQIVSHLPPMLNHPYPQLTEVKANKKLSDSQKLIEYLYTRSLESFLFSKHDLNETLVFDWLSNSSKDVVSLLNYFNLKKGDKSQTHKNAKIIFNLISSKSRVYPNLFDHFVWKLQLDENESNFRDLDELRTHLTIDALARTLYAEAESCHAAGAKQYEAIGVVIANRALSISAENALRHQYYQEISDQVISSLDALDSSESQSFYHNAISDFGRKSEFHLNPLMSSMPSIAQVVSKPGQFAVWKTGSKLEVDVTKWIPQISKLSYPKNIKIPVLSDKTTGTIDGAQKKALCPDKSNHNFDDALKVAQEIVINSSAYTQMYFFKTKNKIVQPYFYTHGAHTKLGASATLFSDVNLYYRELENSSEIKQPLYQGPGGCSTLKLYGERKTR